MTNIRHFNNAVNDEIDKHKWIESEKKGKDIGENNARIEWLVNHWSKFKDYYDERLSNK